MCAPVVWVCVQDRKGGGKGGGGGLVASRVLCAYSAIAMYMCTKSAVKVSFTMIIYTNPGTCTAFMHILAFAFGHCFCCWCRSWCDYGCSIAAIAAVAAVAVSMWPCSFYLHIVQHASSTFAWHVNTK